MNKPAGWITVAHSDNTYEQRTNQCLLSNLKQQNLGGGSKADFLKPLHRIDQPCTGAVIYAKNGKAATRVSNAWKKGQVHKEYYCIVEGIPHMSLKQTLMNSCTLVRWSDDDTNNKSTKSLFGKNDEWNGKDRFLISGFIRKARNRNYNNNNIKNRRSTSRSMEVKALPSLSPSEVQYKDLAALMKQIDSSSSSSSSSRNNSKNDKSDSRICHMEIRPLLSVSSSAAGGAGRTKEKKEYHLLAVRTFTGAKHQVRALLSGIAKLPIAGDLRYGAKTNLPDKSVALHARKLYLPTVKLGDMDFLADEPFVAPIPNEWKTFFGMTEPMINHIESK